VEAPQICTFQKQAVRLDLHLGLALALVGWKVVRSLFGTYLSHRSEPFPGAVARAVWW